MTRGARGRSRRADAPERGAVGRASLLVLTLASHGPVAGCKSKESASRSPTAVDDPATGGGRAAPGAVSGSGDGLPFTNAVAYLIESPDVESTTVIYVFSKPPRCVDLSFSAWDQHIAPGTTFLELKVFGRDSKRLPVVMAETPGPGESVANYVRTAAPEASRELRATGGTVTLGVFIPRSSASVSFSLSFGANHMTGNVSAVFCPGGHEP